MAEFNEAPLVKEIILEKLRQQVLSLRSNTSVKIPSERALSQQLDVSRLSIRTALKKLSEEGLLVQLQGKGTYITPLVKMNSISLLCSPDIKSNDPFYNKFLAEFTNEAAKHSINLIMADPQKPVSSQPGTPLIVIGLLDSSVLNMLASFYNPVVSIQEYPWLSDITQISFDDYKIGCEAAKILFSHHHRKVMHLAGPEKYPSAFFRKKGFLDAAKKLNIHAETVTDRMNWSGGYHLGDLYLQKTRRGNGPTAVFAANDWMAAGFMKRLQESGLKIPGDISVLGCDNIPLSAEYSPALSTFDLNMKLLIKELFTILEKPSAESAGKRIMLPATLILRDSIKRMD